MVWTVKHLLDDKAMLIQGHKSIPAGQHLHNRGEDVLDVQEVP